MSTKKATVGLILIAVGLILLLQSVGVYSIGDLMRYLVPFIFIFLGVWLIVRRRHLDDLGRESTSTPPPPPPSPGESQPPPFTQPHFDNPAGQTGAQTGGGPDANSGAPHVIYSSYQRQSEGKLKFSRTIGDLLVDLNGQTIQDVEVSAVFGSIEIKLHGGRLVEGLNRLVVSGFIGDMRILVPRDLEIFAHCSNFIGDIDLLGKRETGFGNNIDAQTEGYNSASKRLYIAASNFIGDIRVLLI